MRSCSLAWCYNVVNREKKCRILRPCLNPDGLGNLLQSAQKADIIAKARWDKATASAVLPSPSYFYHIYSLKLYTHWLSSPPSLLHDHSPTTGQFVPPAWLPPSLLLCYLASFLHFNGRYWLGNFHKVFASPQKSLLPFPAAFNLITGFLQLFRGGQSQEHNSRPSGFTNTLPRVIWSTRRGVFALLWHQVPKSSII